MRVRDITCQEVLAYYGGKKYAPRKRWYSAWHNYRRYHRNDPSTFDITMKTLQIRFQHRLMARYRPDLDQYHGVKNGQHTKFDPIKPGPTPCQFCGDVIPRPIPTIFGEICCTHCSGYRPSLHVSRINSAVERSEIRYEGNNPIVREQ